MSGHSHWATVKRKKSASDAKRGKIFSKVVRGIIVAVRQGGPDPDKNLRLKYAIERARQVNMPKDNIERAIRKAAGGTGGTNFQERLYEGYGPGGVAILVHTLSDNPNRTAPEIRKIFESRGGRLGEVGCVSWMFETKGLFAVDASAINEDTLLEVALEAGAEDVSKTDGSYEIICAPGDFQKVKEALEKSGFKTTVAEISQIPKQTINLSRDEGSKVVALVEELEEQDDVQNVYSNLNFTEELVSEVSKAEEK